MAEPQSATASIVERAKAIILTPATEWPRIAVEDTSAREVFTNYVLPLAVIGPLCGFIGGRVFGTAMYGPLAHPGILSEAIGAAVAFVLAIITFFVLTLIVDLLAPRFGGNNDAARAAKLVAYASTPIWLAGVFSLVPMFGFLTILGLYSIYLIYIGVTSMLGVPSEKAGGYTVAIIVCGLALNVAVYMLVRSNMLLLEGMGLIG